jgi:hypothetical protein
MDTRTILLAGRRSSLTGLTTMSGVMPWYVHGMSSCRYVIPIVPFCPWRELHITRQNRTPANN